MNPVSFKKKSRVLMVKYLMKIKIVLNSKTIVINVEHLVIKKDNVYNVKIIINF